MKLLLLEDDETTVESIRLCWEVIEPSVEIVAISHGEEALNRLKSESYDVALIDLGLPGMDGIEVIAKLRTFSWIPVIVISARRDTKDITQALEAGADDYLTKPFDYRELQQRVKNLLSKDNSPRTS